MIQLIKVVDDVDCHKVHLSLPAMLSPWTVVMVARGVA
jgi:hypothetical protein